MSVRAALFAAVAAALLSAPAPAAAEDADPSAAADLAALGEEIVDASTAARASRSLLERLRARAAAAEARSRAAAERRNRLLAAAARLGRAPDAAIVADREEPISAARRAMLLRAVLGDLDRADAAAEAAAAEARVAALAAAEQDAVARDRLRALQAAMTEARTLLALRRAAAPEPSDATTPLPDFFPDDAGDAGRSQAPEALAPLLAVRPSRRGASPVAPGSEEAAPAEPAVQAPEVQEPDVQERDVAEPDPASVEPTEPDAAPAVASRRFDADGGRAPRPADGRVERVVTRTLDGLAIWTAPYADVIAPWDAVVRHVAEMAGGEAFVILEPQNGYWLVLSGLGVVDVAAGDRVTAGAMLGQMGGPPPVSDEFLYEASAMDAAVEERLFVEVLRGRRPLDPEPWFGSD